MADEYVSICESSKLLPRVSPSSPENQLLIDSTSQDAVEAAEIKKKRAFRKFSYRGVDLDQYAAP